jgi:hypothetical protein
MQIHTDSDNFILAFWESENARGTHKTRETGPLLHEDGGGGGRGYHLRFKFISAVDWEVMFGGYFYVQTFPQTNVLFSRISVQLYS